jgi:MFS family permease
MYRRLPAFLMGMCAVTSLLIFAFGKQLPLFYIGAVIYGIYSGALYFYMVFHSLSHPERSGFFVAGNEVLVGITSMVSPLVGGMLADAAGFIGTAFIFAAIMSLSAFIAQMIMLNPAKLERL